MNNNIVNLKELIPSSKIDVIRKYIEEHNINVNSIRDTEEVSPPPFLVRQGAGSITKTNLNPSFLNIAVSNERYDVINLLIEKGVDINYEQEDLLRETIEKNNFEMFKFLLDKGAILLDKEPLNDFLLTAIEKKADIKFIELLIGKGADVNVNKFDSDYSLLSMMSPEIKAIPLLQLAIQEQVDISIIELLVKNGVNMTYVNEEGNTYLTIACIQFNNLYINYNNFLNYYKELFSILLDKISIKEKNHKGKTCIHYLSGMAKQIFIEEIYNLEKILNIISSYEKSKKNYENTTDTKRIKIERDNIFDSEEIDDDINLFNQVMQFLVESMDILLYE